jgi:hypothetical protein
VVINCSQPSLAQFSEFVPSVWDGEARGGEVVDDGLGVRPERTTTCTEDKQGRQREESEGNSSAHVRIFPNRATVSQ